MEDSAGEESHGFLRIKFKFPHWTETSKYFGILNGGAFLGIEFCILTLNE